MCGPESGRLRVTSIHYKARRAGGHRPDRRASALHDDFAQTVAGEKELHRIEFVEQLLDGPVVEETDDSNVFLEMMKGEKVAIDHAPTAVSPKVDVEDYDKDTEQYADKKLAIKKFISKHSRN